MNGKVRATHLTRRAVVYVRQSSMAQVWSNTESTARQYQLRARALGLGWGEDDVVVIDEDLGRSGATAEGRSGFARLTDDVAHGRVGLILALEVSRLARSSSDWQQLMRLCAVALAGSPACGRTPQQGAAGRAVVPAADRVRLGWSGLRQGP